jgi:hypothetical protein
MGEVITWQEAEDAMLAAVEYLAALPDRERGFLSAGSRSVWPEIIRDRRAGDYPDADVAPSPQLSRRMMAHLDKMLLTQRAAGLAVAEGHRALVGRVLMMKLWPGPDGFRWERVWEREGGRACGVTSDALRMRYERGIGKVAVRMQALDMGRSEAA